MKTLVRFERSHCDDDEIVAAKSIGAPDAADFFAQLVGELVEQNFTLDLALVKFEDDIIGDGDVYRMYAMIDQAPPMAELVPMLQFCFDQGAAGFFEIIVEGLN